MSGCTLIFFRFKDFHNLMLVTKQHIKWQNQPFLTFTANITIHSMN